jgi:two-component system, chemotaxis family, chemotaxis protein CheY
LDDLPIYEQRGVPAPQSLTQESNPHAEIRKTLYIPRLFNSNKKAERTTLMGTRILLVDDSETTRRVLAALVSRWTVCGEAENGESAVKKFRELKPDLVLLDLALPDVDGIEVGRQMHAIDPSVPLILFTLLDPWGLASAARNAGICRVISKSEASKLIESIEEIVSEHDASKHRPKGKASNPYSAH